MPTDTPAEALDHGTYDLLRERLRTQANQLAGRVEQLNDARKAVFGSVEPTLAATDRVTTDHQCVPRDILAVGERVLFGYNVQFGLKTERAPSDVFSAYEFIEQHFKSLALDLIQDGAFQKDFQEVYRYYKDARFEKFFRRGAFAYMQFRTGAGEADIKTFKWSVEGSTLRYIDNRSDHELKPPTQHEFTWKRPRREDQVGGVHPHISIADRVFVETIGGDLTIKVENNTQTGQGVYQELVDNPDQRLDDAEIQYCLLGSLILLKIRPYQEKIDRHLVYCEKTRKVYRIDGIAPACRLLPADQGILFPSGYWLHTGDGKIFETIPSGTQFEQRIDSPNGEDYLYIFYHREQGLYILLRYNIISQQIDAPLLCHGYTIFDSGEMVCFQAQSEPQRHHALQIWKTPFTSESILPEADQSSALFKIGNREIVRGLSECREILALLEKEKDYTGVYAEVASRGELLDAYYWIREPETMRLDEPLAGLSETALAAVGEFEKVRLARNAAAEQIAAFAERVSKTIAEGNRRRFESVVEFTGTLAELRTLRGEAVGLREIRHIDVDRLSELETGIVAESERIAGRCMGFLDRPEALRPFDEAVADEHRQLSAIATANDAKRSAERVEKIASDLELLIETVSGLPIEDATQRTRVIDAISGKFSALNALRAEIRSRRQELSRSEGAAEFGAQLKLLSQAVVGALDRCDTPTKCDEQYSRLLLQLEELESRFSEFEDFAIVLAEKREEISSAFESRKTNLLEARARKADSLGAAAERLLTGIENRANQLNLPAEIHGYFASDLTVNKVRDLAKQLQVLGDAVRADAVLTQLKAARDDAVRQLRDRQDLFADGAHVLKLGEHHFSVNTSGIELTAIPREGQIFQHLTGTHFYELLAASELDAARDLWEMQFPSETKEVYRGEYLAYRLFQEIIGDDVGEVERFAAMEIEQLTAWVSTRMAPRYAEGYLKGVHDADATKLLSALLDQHLNLGPLQASPAARALGRLFWIHGCPQRLRTSLKTRFEGLREFTAVWPTEVDTDSVRADLTEALNRFINTIDDKVSSLGLVKDLKETRAQSLAVAAAHYLVAGLLADDQLAVDANAVSLTDAFRQSLHNRQAEGRFARSLEAVGDSAVDRYNVAYSWINAFCRSEKDNTPRATVAVRAEAAVLSLPNDEPVHAVKADATTKLVDCLGDHAVITRGVYTLNYHDFFEKLDRHEHDTLPRYRRFIERKHELLETSRKELRLDEFKPRVLTSFVRNDLIDRVYLPLVGANFAKQMGTAGEQTRADRQGLLLLISPPGYGKTTLMEYVANRLGVVFLKVNGPAIGHDVTSLDPAAAPNLAAREELQKLALGFEMGDNVMIYLDDIQHCHPEFLQKFISLCDAQRKVEGVWRGKARTYDLRGRKVAVVMAGNPYTESGDRFQIPDMLANRADVYNLGDVAAGERAAFELSFLENAITSNPVLARLAGHTTDVRTMIKLARGGDAATSKFEGNYTAGEITEMISVVTKLLTIRDAVLAVNSEYIRSAAQADEYRTEPKFQLQGSYRNMNRMAEKVLPAMNDAELQELIWSSYRNDAQTLTTGAEANLLKLRELLGWLTKDERSRWDEIKRGFQRRQKLQGVDASDRFGQAVAQLSLFAEGLSDLRETIAGGLRRMDASAAAQQQAEAGDRIGRQLAAVAEGLGTIERTVADGVRRISETAQPTAMPNQSELLERIVSAVSQQNSPVRVVDEHGGPTGGSEITIVNKIPGTLLNVLREQFRVMDTWLRPIAAATESQRADMIEIHDALRDLLAEYRKLVGRIEAGRE